MRVKYNGKCDLLHGIWEVHAIVPNGETHPDTLSVNNSGRNEYICFRGGPRYTFNEGEIEVVPES